MMTRHDHGCAVMIQLTHLGRRTGWNKGDWLPSISSGAHREPAHTAFVKIVEDWDIARVITDLVDAAERMKAAGRVLLYDQSGDHPGLQAAEMAAEAGAEVEVMTP